MASQATYLTVQVQAPWGMEVTMILHEKAYKLSNTMWGSVVGPDNVRVNGWAQRSLFEGTYTFFPNREDNLYWGVPEDKRAA